MSFASPHPHSDVQDLPGLTSVVRRVVRARVMNPETVDDLVQETLARVFEARARLDDEALAPYAIVTAQNLVRSLARSEDARKRHSHKLIDLREPARPEEETLRREEAAAVAQALARLPSKDREAVVAHEVGGVDTATLATRLDSSPGGVAVRLARARAKLRVEYVMALRKAEPPTPTCRSILIALSSGDTRRQIELNAGEHLLECSYCAELSEPVVERRRSLAALVPGAAAGKLLDLLRRALHSGRVQATTAATVVAAAGVVAVMVSHQQPTPRAQPHTGQPQSRAALETENGTNVLQPGAGLKRFAGRPVDGSRVRVASVPADEGFWIEADGSRLWVQIRNPGESQVHVRAGDFVSFTGRIIRNGPNFAPRAGVGAAEGASRLPSDGYHVVVHRVVDKG